MSSWPADPRKGLPSWGEIGGDLPLDAPMPDAALAVVADALKGAFDPKPKRTAAEKEIARQAKAEAKAMRRAAEAAEAAAQQLAADKAARKEAKAAKKAAKKEAAVDGAVDGESAQSKKRRRKDADDGASEGGAEGGTDGGRQSPSDDDGSPAKRSKKAADTAAGASGTAAPASEDTKGKKKWGGVSDAALKGKRFDKAEDAKLKATIQAWLADHAMPSQTDDDVRAILKTGHRKETRGVWTDIASKMGGRSAKSCLQRAQRLLDHEVSGKWSADEEARLRALVAKAGGKPAWVTIGKALGRNEKSVAAKWREIKLGAAKKTGKWDADETAKLNGLVNDSLRLQGKEADSRDAKIDWTSIADRVEGRTFTQCLEKWKNSTPPTDSLKEDIEWAADETAELVRSIAAGRPASAKDVDWRRAVASRSSARSKQRWKELSKGFSTEGAGGFMYCVRQVAQRFSIALPSGAALPTGALLTLQ